MPEQKRTEVLSVTENGTVVYASDVIAVIAGIAAAEIDGVAAMSGSGISEILGKRNLNRGVRVVIEEEKVRIEVSMQVKYGYKIQEVCKAMQNNIAKAIESMTGLTVDRIDVNVLGIVFEKETPEELPESEA